MVMSQADIDALIAGQAPAGEEDASPAEDDDPSAATENPAAEEEQPAEADAAPAVRSWSASATTETDKLSIRVGEVESRLKAVETADGGSADQGAIDELRGALARANATVERLSAEVQQLTLQSQASLGFDAQHTFDCPSCGSHGTIAVPSAAPAAATRPSGASGPASSAVPSRDTAVGIPSIPPRPCRAPLVRRGPPTHTDPFPCAGLASNAILMHRSFPIPSGECRGAEPRRLS